MNRFVALAVVWMSCSGSGGGDAAPAQLAGRPGAARAEEESGVTRPRLRPEGEPQRGLKVGTVVLSAPPRPPVTLQVELAQTPAQREHGLMFREHLPEDRGMLFLFPSERPHSFWMKNTLIPLDMFFIDSAWNVIGVVENAEPLTLSSRSVPGASQYVLEVNAGFAARHGFGPGTQVRYTPPAEAEP